MSLYTYLMELNKYDRLIANMSHASIILHGHIDPTFFHILPKHNQMQYLLHIIVMYGPAMNMPLKCNIFKLVNVHV